MTNYDSQIKCPNCNWFFQKREHTYENNANEFFCMNVKCYPRKTFDSSMTDYTPFIRMRSDWWFAEYYSIPVKVGEAWFVIWSDARNRTCVSEIIKRQFSFYGGLLSNILSHPAIYTKYYHIDKLTVPYFALPVNSDFENEFAKLKTLVEKALMLQ